MLHPKDTCVDSSSKGHNLKNVTDFGHSARLRFFLASSNANVFLVELFSLGPTGCKHKHILNVVFAQLKLFLIPDSRLVPLMRPKVDGVQLVISFRLDSSLGIFKKMF